MILFKPGIPPIRSSVVHRLRSRPPIYALKSASLESTFKSRWVPLDSWEVVLIRHGLQTRSSDDDPWRAVSKALILRWVDPCFVTLSTPNDLNDDYRHLILCAGSRSNVSHLENRQTTDKVFDRGRTQTDNIRKWLMWKQTANLTRSTTTCTLSSPLSKNSWPRDRRCRKLSVHLQNVSFV